MEFDFSPVDSIDKVPEQFRGIYAENSDGKFTVNEAHSGIAEAVNGLNRSLKAARADARNKQSVDLSVLNDFGKTPEEIKQSVDNKIKDLQTELAKGGDAKLNLEKIREDMASAHSKDLEKASARSEALQGQLYKLLVENKATTAVSEAKGIPDLLLPFIKNQVKVVEEDGTFKVFVVDPAGDRRYSGVTGEPMTINELVAEMKINEKFGRLFESEHSHGGGGMPPAGAKVPQQKGAVLTATQKIAAGLGKNQAKTRNRR